MLTPACLTLGSAPLHQEDYLSQLSRFPQLRFFAWDRQSPRGPDEQDRRAVRQSQVEYGTLARLGGACKRLREAVCLTSDVSEGCVPRVSLLSLALSCRGLGRQAGSCRRRQHGETD